MEPSTPFAKTAAITGWPLAPATDTDGSEEVQLLGMSAVSSVGATTNYDGGVYCNEPAQISNVNIWLSSTSTALASFGSCVDRTTGATNFAYKAVTSPSYSLYSFSQVKECTLNAGEGNATTWRSMGLGYNGGSNDAGKFNTICFLFDQAQTKLITHSLNLQFFHTWSRVLSPSSI
jgi:hypothetical protein